MIRIFGVALIVSLFILLSGYPLSAMQNSIAPADGMGSFDEQNTNEGEQTEQEYRDTMDKTYPSTPIQKQYTKASTERYEG
jgi:hypothetical protein